MSKALAAAKEIQNWYQHTFGLILDDISQPDIFDTTWDALAAIISEHFPSQAAVPVSELQHIVDNVSAVKDLRIKLQQLIHRYQPAGDDNEKV